MGKCLLACVAVLMAFSACTRVDPKYRCINGHLYTIFGGVWVKTDGRNYIGFPDGPMLCVGEKANG